MNQCIKNGFYIGLFVSNCLVCADKAVQEAAKTAKELIKIEKSVSAFSVFPNNIDIPKYLDREDEKERKKREQQNINK